jgi:exopolysaccharide biosynthesis protein
MRRSLLLIALCLTCFAARGEFPTSQPYPGVTYSHQTRENPAQSLYVVTVNLADPHVKVRLTPAGADPDGDGEWQTTLQPVRAIAEREKFDVAVNASFFEIPKAGGEIAEEKAERSGAPATTVPVAAGGYRTGVWSKSVGWAMTDGRLWSKQHRGDWPAFWIDERGRGHIGQPDELPRDARQLVQGNVLVLKDGKPIAEKGNAKVRHPRTVLGVDASGTRLTILTIDGRRPGTASGMTGTEMGQEMLRLGCTDALNLDGGGSTTLVVRDPESGEEKVVNRPSDGHERSVADVLGVEVDEKEN